MPAGAGPGDFVAADVVPVADDDRGAAARAIGGAALTVVVDVAGLHEPQPDVPGDPAGPGQGGRRVGGTSRIV